MAFVRRFNDWGRGEAGLGSVLGHVFQLRDKRPYYAEEAAAGHGDD
jgi:hypothetical protein